MNSSKRALITGITGQDGSYLAELLIAKGYTVHGVVRRSSNFNTKRVDHLVDRPNFYLHYGDLTDGTNISKLVRDIMPNEFYNLGAQSHVGVSFQVPEYSGNVDGLGTIRVLDAVKTFCPGCRVYQASTSELYGNSNLKVQNEETPFHPRSPYAAAKLYAYWVTATYRESYGLFACNGILFNHESERRGETFVTRKISKAVARIVADKQDVLLLGNLKAKRDWGYAPEYVEGMWRMLQQADPVDLVLATGITYSVEEFCSVAFSVAGVPITFEGEGKSRVGYTSTGRVVVKIDPKYYRPAEVDFLCGDASKAYNLLGWKPTVTFSGLVQRMVEWDMRGV